MIIGKKEKDRSGLIEKDLICLRQCGSANNKLSENEGIMIGSSTMRLIYENLLMF